jgi:hypothetical protein
MSALNTVRLRASFAACQIMPLGVLIPYAVAG